MLKIAKNEHGPLSAIGNFIGEHKVLSTAVVALALAGLAINQSRSGETVKGPKRVYIVKPGDTQWSISERAFPDNDPREHLDMINGQAKNKHDKKYRILHPGQRILLPPNAEVGRPLATKK